MNKYDLGILIGFFMILWDTNFTVAQEKEYQVLNNMEWMDYISDVPVNTEIEEYQYDSEGKVVSSVLSLWNQTSQKYQYKYRIITFYNGDWPDTKIYGRYDSKSSLWVDTLKRVYQYTSAGNLEQMLIYSKSSSVEVWQPAAKEERFYDAGNNFTLMYFYEWDPDVNAWENVEKNSYTYNSQSYITSYTSWVWDFLFDEWIYYDKEEYRYEDNWNKFAYYEWNEWLNKWDNIYKDSTTYRYTETGLEFALLSCYWDSGRSQWIKFTREKQVLNSDSLITEFTEYEWNENTSRYDYYDHELYTYDNYRNVILFIDEDRKDGQFNEWEGNLKEVYEYDNRYLTEQLIIPWEEPRINDVYFNTMMVSIDAYDWNGSLWKQASNGVFDYSDFVVSQNNSSSFQAKPIVYPNPFGDYLIIAPSGEIDDIRVEIFTSTGQLVKSLNVLNSIYIQTSELPSGLYLIKVKSDKDHIIKLIKK